MTPDLRRLRCRLLSVLVLCLGLGIWLYHGGRLGFWLTSVETYVPDPVMVELGIDDMLVPVREERFVAGIETPVGALALALLLWGISFLFPDTNRNSKEPS